jgi:hypothetical protein
VDIASGTANGNNPTNNNFIIAQMANSFDLRSREPIELQASVHSDSVISSVESYIGDAATGLTLPNFWAGVLGGWSAMCVTVDGAGNIQVYMCSNGGQPIGHALTPFDRHSSTVSSRVLASVTLSLSCDVRLLTLGAPTGGS